jgi:amidohydrolase
LLIANQDRIRGTIKLVFQPAEEGEGGAERMVAEGVLDNPRPDYSLALHVWNEKPVGWIGVTPGPAMAASETFYITITGRGGHGAAPHTTIDPIPAAAQVISALQNIVARNVPPLETAVVSVTSIHSGTTFNVIPQKVELSGTIRTFNPEVRQMVLDRFCDIVDGITQGMNCTAEIDLQSVTPAVINDSKLSSIVQQTTRTLYPELVLDTTERTMGSEDMAFMMDDIPGCYVFIGSANAEKGLDYKHHHPRFDIDEEALTIGAALITESAISILSQ